MELFEIADLSRLWVLADVYEHEIGRVRVGQTASVEVSAFPSDRFSAKVGFIYPTLDPATRTLRVRLELDNDDHKLYPAMFANVAISLDPQKGVVIPTEALIDTGTAAYVFVTNEPGRFEPRRVRAGRRASGRVEISEGIHEGEAVVTTANFLIDSESRLRAALEGG
jgi:Cu(I)/Ag(I) efflux system membrane fusion protein